MLRKLLDINIPLVFFFGTACCFFFLVWIQFSGGYVVGIGSNLLVVTFPFALSWTRYSNFYPCLCDLLVRRTEYVVGNYHSIFSYMFYFNRKKNLFFFIFHLPQLVQDSTPNFNKKKGLLTGIVCLFLDLK